MIVAQLNELQLPPIEHDFIMTPLEMVTDVVTLGNEMFTDFSGETFNLWTFNYAYLTEAQFNAIKAIYDEQFTLYQYPLLTIDHYSVEDMPVRMTLNPRTIADHCGTVQGVQITFRETAQLPEGS